ncbi:MotA/TolQ/ExbB proton channel family protein [Bdellovibrio sp. SKB1291214]|uniref:MotA/TolQ/ExbB proton channel family protein n=1 Tax=Bdellovibrio sp. SKB1291214 TaxID=1732569 RepID=UPI000B51B501|nr:MotA/TolQ/ExbB proton channel family protein [Bdellovibrio sp. SKB1291214]UYL08136.1 MotA/TolQ/ExbB proton channel family protein [Bdellovibrio sp. SKB1291214]
MEFLMSLGRGFTSGDAIWMWTILAAQIVSVAIIAERSIALFMNRKVNQKDMSKTIADDIKAGKLDQALRRSMQMGLTQPLGVVASAGIQAAIDMGGKEEIQLKMDEILLEESSRVEKRIGFLAMFANVATLLGLLGTITGLIHSFAGIANANPAEKAAILSQGISLAMNTTAYGLVVAVPALIMYAVLQNRATRLTEDLNKAALNLFIQLGYHYAPVSDKKEKALK